MAAVLASSSALSGAAAGFAGGVAALLVTPVVTSGSSPVPSPSPLSASASGSGSVSALSALSGGALAAVVVAVALTVVLEVSPVPPLSVRRQVPQLWGRIFSARTTALLYGARLGVGPLTILRTWWWWPAFVLGALAGVWWSVLVGAVFGLARVVVMVAAGPRAGERGERPVAVGGAFAVAAAAAAAVAVALTVAPPTAASDPVSGALDATDGGDRVQNEMAAGAAGAAIPAAAPPDTGLGSALPQDVGDGFERVGDDHRDGLGPLDLDTAVAVEQDPSAERALLETRRFQAGHARAWRAAPDAGGEANGLVVYAAVYRFASAEDAAAYLTDGFVTLESRGARTSDVADPPGGRAFSQAASDEDGSRVAHGVAFVRGDRFFLVFESARTSAATADHAAAVARTVDAWQRTATR